MSYHPASIGARDYTERDEVIIARRTPTPTMYEPALVWPQREPEPLPTITPVVLPEEDYYVTDATYTAPTEPIDVDPGFDPYEPVEAGTELPTFIDIAADEENPIKKYGMLIGGLLILGYSMIRNRRQ